MFINKHLARRHIISQLAMALTATLMKDDVDTELLKDSLISEAKNAIKEFVLDSGADDEEDEI